MAIVLSMCNGSFGNVTLVPAPMSHLFRSVNLGTGAASSTLMSHFFESVDSSDIGAASSSDNSIVSLQNYIDNINHTYAE